MKLLGHSASRRVPSLHPRTQEGGRARKARLTPWSLGPSLFRVGRVGILAGVLLLSSACSSGWDENESDYHGWDALPQRGMYYDDVELPGGGTVACLVYSNPSAEEAGLSCDWANAGTSLGTWERLRGEETP